MNAKLSRVAEYPRRLVAVYREETGESLAIWATIALLALLTQIVLRRELFPGEFGTVNTALGVIGLMTVPLLAVKQALSWHVSRAHDPAQEERLEAIRASSFVVTETFAWVWAVVGVLLLSFFLSLLWLPRFSMHLLVLINVLIALGGVLSGTICRNRGQLRLWTWLVVSSAIVRFVLCIGMPYWEPWADAALVAFIIAGLITCAPSLRPTDAGEIQRVAAVRAVFSDRAFLLDLGATLSVLTGTYLFISADRIVAQSWFGAASNNNIGYINWPIFDAYQTAGLVGRSILWGTQPLLLMLFLHRSKLNRTTTASLEWFWIYFGAVMAGVIVVDLFHGTIAWIFCGQDYRATAHFIPGLTMTMIPLGLLQGIGVFALASRRYPECFVLGGCAIGYTLLLYLVGRQPFLMPAYMFGGGVVSLMIVLFVGVVRWGRKQP